MSKFKLNKEQEKAVTYDGTKPLVIQAGPGAGKTRVMVERVKYLVNKKQVAPESLLVITFTKKASEELKERLSEDMPASMVNKMQISTIHGFCNRLLSENGSSGLEIISDDTNEKLNMFIKKHKKELGFKYESYLPNSQIDDIINKFDEYSMFKVNTPELIEYIKENNPIDESYHKLIQKAKEKNEKYFEFPYDDVQDDQILKDSWYNAKYQTAAKAYPRYIELLEEEGAIDYNQLQIKAKELLEDKEVLDNLRYKNILIDEFQDTDPIQMGIFNKLLENYETFTIVGDDDQSIYGFRGSQPKYFTEFTKNHDSEVITLKTNYRSTGNIVEFNENFIKDDRVNKKELQAVREKNTKIYYLENSSEQEEAERIVQIIKDLKDNSIIKQYSDIGILFRATQGRLKDLVNQLNLEEIPYTMNNIENFLGNDEVRAAITLIWYMSKRGKVLSKWERGWLNLKAFTDTYYNASKIFNLSDNTMKLLIEKEDEYQQQVIEAEHEVYYEKTGKKSRKRTFSGIFNRKDEIVDEVLNRVERIDLSKMNRQKLKEFGIRDEHDLNFFEKLYNLKQEFYDEELEEKPTILDTYYNLLDITGYLDDKFKNRTDANIKILKNLALISNTIYNYENILSNHDITGLYWFLCDNYDNYNNPDLTDDINDAVEIMTIHKSKGLEFPVVIVGSLEEDKFPRKYDPEELIKRYKAKKAQYPTPKQCLEYKDEHEDEKEIHDKEERRVLYVATTRAEDLLILSSIPHDEVARPGIVEELKEKNPEFTRITENEIKKIEPVDSEIKENSEKPIGLSYSSLNVYNASPDDYYKQYILGFRKSRNDAMIYGLFVHAVLNSIHQKSLQGNKVTDEIIDSIIEMNLKYNKKINAADEDIEKLNENIHNYWNKYGKTWHILASELPFNIINNNSNIKGKIDLIIKDDNDDITIIDFKTTYSDKIRDETPYKRQLYIYMKALEENPEYENYNIKNTMIFTMYDCEIIPIIIDENEKEKLNNNIIETVENIKENFIN